jgi:hypothetical protein
VVERRIGAKVEREKGKGKREKPCVVGRGNDSVTDLLYSNNGQRTKD